LNHEIAISGDGAATKLAVVTLCWPGAAVDYSRLNPIHPF
jgi:hypothetical protein